MRTRPKDKAPTIVYYIKDSFGGFTGPYGNKPSKRMLDKVYEGKVVTYNLTETK